MIKIESRSKGYALALLAALSWGISGTCAQFLFNHRNVSPEWLVTVRLLLAGLILLSIPARRELKAVLLPWKEKRDRLELFAFGIFGMLAVQYTYFVAIKASNAATATILQYLGPVFIVVYESWKLKRLPHPRKQAAVALAALGTFFLVGHGSFQGLYITGAALFWGLASALALALYSIIPVRLLNCYEAPIVVGWGMLIGGFCLSFLYVPWKVSGTWDMIAVLNALFILSFGSILAFSAYLISVRIVGATVASLLVCAEPLSAAVISVLVLNVSFGFFDWLGSLCILITIALLTLKDRSAV